MAAFDRIYLIRSKSDPKAARLVRASHPSHAMRHVAEGAFEVEVAGQEDLVSLLGKGAKVEDIGQEQKRLQGA